MSRQPGPLLFNPALLPREELIGSFLVRGAELEEILAQVRAATPDHAPQHLLVIGWRGMGKTTLLHRVAYAVEDDAALSKEWQPVLFDEEQFNVGELADFWLNALEMLGQACGDPALRQESEGLPDRYRDDALEEAAHDALKSAAEQLGKRLLLLVDNVDMVLDRLDERESSRLREILQHEPWLMLSGTSSRAIESTYDYGQAFYEMFKVVELTPLDDGETLTMLRGLADRYDAPQVAQVTETQAGKIARLKLLMGGNPRTVALLFGVLQKGPDGDLWSQLERLLDASTSLYKDRLESLPVQAQRVFDALAQHWDPATAETIADRLRLQRGVVSGQLHRLVDRGLVEKVKLPGRAIGFQVRERFFNIWCLMRGGRRSRQRLRWLVEFMELFYDEEQVRLEAGRLKTELHALNSEASKADIERLIGYSGTLINLIRNPGDRVGLFLALARTSIWSEFSADLVDAASIREFVHREDLLPSQSLTLLFLANLQERRSDARIDFYFVDLVLRSAILEMEEAVDENGTDLNFYYLGIALEFLEEPEETWTNSQRKAFAGDLIRRGLSLLDMTNQRVLVTLLMVLKTFSMKGHSAELVEVLDETGWGERLRPLREALLALAEDREELQRLAPEQRQLVIETQQFLKSG